VSGGLMSYGTRITDSYHQVGTSIPARFSKVLGRRTCQSCQSTKFEFVLNLTTAKALFEVPPQLLARADEVIE
jgi:putative tryptophan/tyrosine transport system substrate-binding protein